MTLYESKEKIMQEPYEKADLDEAVETLRRGGIILYPTDTVWGIGCDATNEEAVRRIYDLKSRAYTVKLEILLKLFEVYLGIIAQASLRCYAVHLLGALQ